MSGAMMLKGTRRIAAKIGTQVSTTNSPTRLPRYIEAIRPQTNSFCSTNSMGPGLLIWGLQPGPMLFVEQKEFVWGLIASMYLGNLVGLFMVLTCVPIFAAILRVPFSIIAPLILVLCAIGAYSVHSSTFDVMLMLVFGVLGYLLKKCNYPLAPLVLAIVLGDKAEEAFRQSLLGSQGSLGVFFSNGLVSTIMVLGLIALFWSAIQEGYSRLRAAAD